MVVIAGAVVLAAVYACGTGYYHGRYGGRVGGVSLPRLTLVLAAITAASCAAMGYGAHPIAMCAWIIGGTALVVECLAATIKKGHEHAGRQLWSLPKDMDPTMVKLPDDNDKERR